ERLLAQIEQSTHPSQEQRDNFNGVSEQSSNMTKLLVSSCARNIPHTPLERLDVAIDQLTSMNFAAVAVNLELNGYYSRLTDEQKNKFDSIGGGADGARSPTPN